MTFRSGIQADVVLDSIAPDGKRLTTVLATYNRFIMAEIMMHRNQSRSSASSRAIPFDLMLERAINHPAPFVEYPSEQPGMSGGTHLEGEDLDDALAMLQAIQDSTTGILSDYIERHPDKSTRLHKSLLNRTLEWFSWTTTCLSATEWENYFRQRAHPAAQPEFRELAYAVREAIANSEPKPLAWFEWHLPWLDPETDGELSKLEQIKVSVARCARTSYLNHDGSFSHEADFKLYDNTLATNGHWAPLEHAAVCLPNEWGLKHYGNFERPWYQFRHMIEYGEGSDALAQSVIAQGERA